MKLSFSQRANFALTGFRAAVTGQWEGGQRDRRRNRPGTRLTSQDTDLNYGTRESLLSEARALDQTDPIVGRIRRQYSRHCVGALNLKWNTGNPGHDKAFSDYWKSWMKIADVSGVHHFRKLTRLAVGSAIRDGDVFAQMVDSSGTAQLRLIEGDRVTNSAGGSINVDQPNIVGGVIISPLGRPVAYRVFDRTQYGTFQNPRDLPASEVVHLFFADRIDAYRGVTHFHSVLDAIRDFKETSNAESLAAKMGSMIALIRKSLTGGPSSAAFDPFGGQTTETGAPASVEKLGDMATLYHLPGEDVKAHQSARPSDGWQYLMEMRVRQISIGLDLPFGVVWNMAGLGGPAARFEINQAQRVFAEITDELEQRWIRRIAIWVIAKAANNGAVPRNPNWFQFKIPRPAYLTIDLGRDSKAGIAENLAGLGTATAWYAEEEEDFEEETDRLAYEAGYRRRAAEREGVPIEDIRQTTPNGNSPSGQVNDGGNQNG